MTRLTMLLGCSALALAIACTKDDPNLTVPYGHGQLAVQLTADTKGSGSAKRGTAGTDGEVTEIHVTVVKVTAHAPGGWTTLSENTVEVDLLNFDAAATDLGLVNLPVGDVNQIRLYTKAEGNYVVLADGTSVELKVPSGAQSGIKVKGPFHVSECNRTNVSLAFDGKHSIFVHGTGAGRYILRPVIRVGKHSDEPLTCTGDPDGGTNPGDGEGTPDGGTDGTPDGGVDGTPDGGGETSGGETTPPPPPAGPGESCTVPSDCLSGDCQAGICQPGAPGTPCESASDCGTNICEADGTCGGEGTPGGGTCTNNSECLSGACEAGACIPGGQGAACNVNGDCADGFACISDFCEPVILN